MTADASKLVDFLRREAAEEYMPAQKDMYLQAADALEAARVDAWLPIETAPRVELAEVLLFNGDEVVAGALWEGRWTTAYDDIEPQPTHWRPLPEPPAIDAAMADAARGEGGV